MFGCFVIRHCHLFGTELFSVDRAYNNRAINSTELVDKISYANPILTLNVSYKYSCWPAVLSEFIRIIKNQIH